MKDEPYGTGCAIEASRLVKENGDKLIGVYSCMNCDVLVKHWLKPNGEVYSEPPGRCAGRRRRSDF